MSADTDSIVPPPKLQRISSSPSSPRKSLPAHLTTSTTPQTAAEKKYPDSPSQWMALRSNASLSPVSEEAFPVDKRKKYKVSEQELVLDARYTPIKKLGLMDHVLVISANDEKLESKVIIKKFAGVFSEKEEKNNMSRARKAVQEVKILQHLDHDNILKMIDIINPLTVQQFEDLYIVTEYMQSNLAAIVKSNNELSEDHIAFIMFQILQGLKALQQAKLVHRELVPTNILINGDCSLKLSEFQNARSSDPLVKHDLQTENKESYVSDELGLNAYTAPELMLNPARYSFESDMWSVACIFAELFLREPLFKISEGSTPVELIEQIMDLIDVPEGFADDSTVCKELREFVSHKKRKPSKSLKQLIPEASEVALDLLTKMLSWRSRISCSDALKHDFFKRVTEDMVQPDLPEEDPAIILSALPSSGPSRSLPIPAGGKRNSAITPSRIQKRASLRTKKHKPRAHSSVNSAMVRKMEDGSVIIVDFDLEFDFSYVQLTRNKLNMQELVFQEIIRFRPQCIHMNPLETKKRDPRVKRGSRRMFQGQKRSSSGSDSDVPTTLAKTC